MPRYSTIDMSAKGQHPGSKTLTPAKKRLLNAEYPPPNCSATQKIQHNNRSNDVDRSSVE
jgi:hypothetical protein